MNNLTPKPLPDVKLAPTMAAGVTHSELKILFSMSDSDVKKLLLQAGVKPTGLRDNRYQIFNLKDAVKALVAPDLSNADEMMDALIRTPPSKWPAKWQKTYWDAKTARQTFERRAGDLWDTAKVVEIASGTFKLLRMSVLLIPDTLAREAGLSETQRTIVQRMIDNMLNEMQESLRDALENRRDDSVSEPGTPDEDGSGEPGPDEASDPFDTSDL